MKKNKLTKKQVLHIASLANLLIQKSEINMYTIQLNDVLGYINKLNQLDTKKTEPTAQVTLLKNIWREDNIALSLSQKDALSNTKHSIQGYFVTKAIFSNDE